jgi:predicted nuclease of predicted toxin-antitoxin system
VRILVDEDLASRELISLLRTVIGEDLLAPEIGAPDEDVWRRAQSEGAAILTGNVVDFLRLARDHPDHDGLLLVFRTNDRSTDLRAADIARAVERVAHEYRANIRSLVLAVNDFAR